jgi:hypothetical protein
MANLVSGFCGCRIDRILDYQSPHHARGASHHAGDRLGDHRHFSLDWATGIFLRARGPFPFAWQRAVTGTEVALVISSISTLLGVVGGIGLQIRGQNVARLERAQLRRGMEEVKDATDGLSERLGETKLAQGTAEGTAIGLAAGRAENKA